ncbi:SRR1 family protein [Aspergillus lucknowensis]|uniref:SRR1-like domain-containing protein n=1 Tax=Aspergillus lucknowensis TaxID=176173 RepID=A0ABR4LYR9_9EURO
MGHYVVGPCHLADGTFSRKTESPTEARSRIDEWLDKGKVFFPREAIRDIHEQLKRPLSKGDKIPVKSLDGTKLVFEVRTGETRDIGQHREDIGKPSIRYISYESLRAGVESTRDYPHLIYCNLRIKHEITFTDIETGEPAPSIAFKSLSEAERLFDTALRVWEESEVWGQIEATLVCVASTINIKKIVGFACGTMVFPEDTPYFSYNSAFQHAFLVTAQRLLQRRHANEVFCYVQDPAYTERDQSVLEAHGIKVVDDPEGFLEVDESSLVFSCAPNVPVKQIIADIARPAVIIWDRVGNGNDKGHLETDPDSPRVRQVMSSFYRTLEFPHDEHFGDIAVYARKDLGGLE